MASNIPRVAVSDVIFRVLRNALREQAESVRAPKPREDLRTFLRRPNAATLRKLLVSLSEVAGHAEQEVIRTLKLFLTLYEGNEKTDKKLLLLQEELKQHFTEEQAQKSELVA